VKFVKSLAGLAVACFVLAAPAHAQFSNLGGMLGGGGSKGGGGDPAKIEQDLKSIIETTSVAMAGFAAALDLKEKAARFSDNAACIKAATCATADAINVVTSIGPEVLAEADRRRSQGLKLDSEAGANASKALIPAVKAFPLWKQVADGASRLDKSAVLKFAGLLQAAPKVPAAAKGTIDVVEGGIKILTFSGIDTSQLENEAKSNLKF
jgi:hypothetical protein